MEIKDFLHWSVTIPAALVLFGIPLFFMLLFRKSIERWIDRIKRVGKNGIETPQELQKIIMTKEEPSAIEELMRGLDTPVIRVRVKFIKEDFEKGKITEDSEKVKVLMSYLAAAQTARDFEFVNGIIYGSQLKILYHLNSLPNGDTKEAIQGFYKIAALAYPDFYKRVLFNQYINFLIEGLLIEEKGERYYITQFGKEFLQYLVATGRTYRRAF